jgi:hypothetical protein
MATCPLCSNCNGPTQRRPEGLGRGRDLLCSIIDSQQRLTAGTWRIGQKGGQGTCFSTLPMMQRRRVPSRSICNGPTQRRSDWQGTRFVVFVDHRFATTTCSRYSADWTERGTRHVLQHASNELMYHSHGCQFSWKRSSQLWDHLD